MTKFIFEQNSLIDFFEKINQLGRTVTFSKIPENENVFLIRHDIDLDLVPAYKMALLEKECGIISSFFIMVSNQSYNILSEKNRQLLNEISDMGFEIGLHFDPTVYHCESKEILQEKVRFEASVIEDIINKKILSISLHKPSIHNNFLMFDHYVNAYDPQIFSDDVYMSDSSMNFRGKDPFSFIENIKEKNLQILLHPIHFGLHRRNYTEILKETTLRFAQNIDSEFREMNPTYRATVDENTISKMLFS